MEIIILLLHSPPETIVLWNLDELLSLSYNE